MAVRRGFGGLGDQSLSWMSGRAHQERREFIRLDCVADNSGLCLYNQVRRLTTRGEVVVGGAPGQRRTDGAHMTTMMCLERSLLPSPGRTCSRGDVRGEGRDDLG